MTTFNPKITFSYGAFEELYRASPVPKIVRDQFNSGQQAGTGKLSSSSVKYPNAFVRPTVSKKAQLLQILKKKPPPSTLVGRGEDSHVDLSESQCTTTGSIELSTSIGSLDQSEDLSITLTDDIGNDKSTELYPDQSNDTTVPTANSIACRTSSSIPHVTGDLGDQSPALKQKINDIVSRLSNESDSDVSTDRDSDADNRVNSAKPETCSEQLAKPPSSPGNNSRHDHIKGSLISAGQSRNNILDEMSQQSADSSSGATVPYHSKSISLEEYTDSDDFHQPGDGKHLNKHSESSHRKQKTVETSSISDMDTRTSCVISGGEIERSLIQDKLYPVETPKGRISSGNKSKPKHQQVLHEWIVKPLPICRGVFVEGQRSEDPIGNFWHSTAIVKRVDSRTVETASGAVYILVGKIEKLYALEAGFSLEVVRKFTSGFPVDWETVLQEFYDRSEKGSSLCRHVQKIATDELNLKNNTDDSATPVLNIKRRPLKKPCKPHVHDVLNNSSIQPALDELPRTKSGRVIKPQLAGWAGQRIRVHNRTGNVEITSVHSPLLDISVGEPKSRMRCLRLSDFMGQSQVKKKIISTPPVVHGNKRRRVQTPRPREENCFRETRLRSGKKFAIVISDEKDDTTEETTTDDGQKVNPVSPKKNLNLEDDILGILADSKKDRSLRNSTVHRETCYSSGKSSKHHTERLPCRTTKKSGHESRKPSGRRQREPTGHFTAGKNRSPAKAQVNLRAIKPDRCVGNRNIVGKSNTEPIIVDSTHSSDVESSSDDDDITPVRSSGRRETRRVALTDSRPCRMSSSKNCDRGPCQTKNGVRSRSEQRWRQSKSRQSVKEEDSSSGEDTSKTPTNKNKHVLAKLNSHPATQSAGRMRKGRDKVTGTSSRRTRSSFGGQIDHSRDNSEIRTKSDLRSVTASKDDCSRRSRKSSDCRDNLPVRKEKFSSGAAEYTGSKTSSRSNRRRAPSNSDGESSVGNRTGAKITSTRSCKTVALQKLKLPVISSGSDSDSEHLHSQKHATQRKKRGRLRKEPSYPKTTHPDSRSNRATHAKSNQVVHQTENSEVWKKKENDALYKAIRSQAPDDPEFWQRVANAVPSKSLEQCRQHYYKDAPEKLTRKNKEKLTKSKDDVKSGTLSGNVGTLKRKRELRDLLDQRNEGYEDDIFDSTPMKTRALKVPTLDDDDDIFGDKLPFETPSTSRTPLLRYHAEPVSERKTPHIGLGSPEMLKTVNRYEIDRYIHGMKKRRKIVPEKRIKSSKKKKPAASGYHDDLFTTEQKSDDDSEEEKDYYWSDELEK